MPSYKIHHCDCRLGVADLEPDSIHAIVTDPPYGLKFMSKEWDHGIPGVEFWQAFYRVLKETAYPDCLYFCPEEACGESG